MWTRGELKGRGKATMKANYWGCVLVALLLSFCTGGAGSGSANKLSSELQSGDLDTFLYNLDPGILIGFAIALLGGVAIAIALSIFVFDVFTIGCYRYFVINHFNKPTAGEVLFGFQNNYGKNVLTLFLKGLFTWLWSLLFIIPGIIKGYEYRMIPYILADQPNLSREEAFALSKKMMTGQKWNAFVLDLSFLGWEILSAFTCGILYVFYVGPYIQTTNAELYLTLKNQNPTGYQNQQYQNQGFQNQQYQNQGFQNQQYQNQGYQNQQNQNQNNQNF